MRRNNLTAKIPALWLLLSLRPLFPNVPWALAVGEFCRCSHWDWTPQLLSFWMVVVFWNIYVYVNTYMHIKTIYDKKKASMKLRNREGYVQDSGKNGSGGGW